MTIKMASGTCPKIGRDILANAAERGMGPVALANENGVSWATVVRAEVREGIFLSRSQLPIDVELDRIDNLKPLEAIEMLKFMVRELSDFDRAIALSKEFADARLTHQKAQIAATLLKNEGKLVSKERIFASVWGAKSNPPETDCLSVLICHIRQRAKHLFEIKTHHGVGYSLHRKEGVVFSWEMPGGG